MNRKHWTTKEDDILRSLFADTLTSEIAKILNRSYGSVSGRAYIFGLKKSEAFLKSDLSGRISKMHDIGEKYRFKKGCIPFNKGKKVSKETYEKCKKTMFKKGNLPWCTKSDGEITIRHSSKKKTKSYKWIRISLGKWKLLHQHIWEAENGKIPDGYHLWFIDGNTLNCSIENLELITRAENIKRNSIQRYPQEIKQSIRLLTKLKKKINAKRNN